MSSALVPINQKSEKMVFKFQARPNGEGDAEDTEELLSNEIVDPNNKKASEKKKYYGRINYKVMLTVYRAKHANTSFIVCIVIGGLWLQHWHITSKHHQVWGAGCHGPWGHLWSLCQNISVARQKEKARDQGPQKDTQSSLQWNI